MSVFPRMPIVLAAVALVLVASLTATASADPQAVADGKQPRLAIGTDGAVVLVYGRESTIYLKRSTDHGATFGDEQTVGSLPGLMLGARRGPRVAATGKAIIVTAVARMDGESQGNVVMWRSTDNGASWSDGTPLNSVPTSGREGLHGLAANADGRVMSVWLDLRNGTTELWGRSSKDHGEDWDRNRLVYKSPGGTICQCCHPSVSYDGKGHAWVMFRNLIGGNRDMFVLKSRDGRRFGRPGKLGEGSWKLAACPMDGGEIVGLANGDAVTIWRRESNIFVAEPGEVERNLGRGFDSTAAADGEKVHMVWVDRPRNGAVHYRAPGAATGQKIADGATQPVIAADTAGTVVIAWEANNRVMLHVQAAPAAEDGDDEEDSDDEDSGGR